MRHAGTPFGEPTFATSLSTLRPLFHMYIPVSMIQPALNELCLTMLLIVNS